MNQELYDQIDAYLLRRLTKAEQTAFEQVLQEDTTLATQVQEQQALLIGAQIVGREQLQSTVQEIAEEMDLDTIDIPVYGDFSNASLQKGIQVVGKEQLQNDLTNLQSKLENENFFNDVFAQIESDSIAAKIAPPPQQQTKVRRLIPRSRQWAVAASIAILVAITSVVLFNLNQNKVSGLATIFEPQTEILTQRIDAQLTGTGLGTGEIQKQLEQIQAGLKDLNQGNYNAAVANLSSTNLAFLGMSDRLLLQLALGQAQLGTEQFESAIYTLKPLAADENFVAQEDAQWYLLFAYVNTKNTKNVRDLKQQLQSSTKYRKKVNSF